MLKPFLKIIFNSSEQCNTTKQKQNQKPKNQQKKKSILLTVGDDILPVNPIGKDPG